MAKQRQNEPTKYDDELDLHQEDYYEDDEELNQLDKDSSINETNSTFEGEQECNNDSLISGFEVKLEQDLNNLQLILDRLSDDYADKAELMIRNFLSDCRTKARARISSVSLDYYNIEKKDQTPLITASEGE